MGGYGQLDFDQIMEPKAEAMREAGAESHGFGLDNFLSNANNIDFERAHLAACGFSPTFGLVDYRPVIAGVGRL